MFAKFVLFLMSWLCLFAYYGARKFAVPDSIFPTFVVDVMPPGLTGLVVAAILAASMSTLSGSINSLAAATVHDIWLPLTRGEKGEKRTFRMARVFSLLWGIGLLGAALLYREQGTPVVIIALSIASFTYGALLGGFFLGMLWRRAIQRDAILGMAMAIGVMTFIVFAGRLLPLLPSMAGILTPFSKIAWPWYVLIGTSITMIVGILSS